MASQGRFLCLDPILPQRRESSGETPWPAGPQGRGELAWMGNMARAGVPSAVS